ncbi:MAG: serpin family protein [Terracidiphilus sp.]
MNLLHAAILTALAAPTLAATQTSADQSTAPSPAAEAAVVKGNTAFAVGLYRQLRSQPGNLFFSPESISIAFAMALAGARGQTATQMEGVLRLTLPPDELHPAMGKLLAQMNEKNPNYQLSAADALWAQQNQNFQPAYLKLVEANYAAAFHQVNFLLAPETARTTINQWIEKQTNNKIPNLVPPGAITPSTRLVLTNAIYFKGDWLDPFDERATADADFHLSSTQTVKAPMMHESSNFNFFDDTSFQALELPYKGNALSMVVLLPKDVAGLPALEQSLTPATLTGWLGNLRSAPKVIVSLPRFTMTQQFELSSALSAMGMQLAFTGAADFSGMDGERDFTISAAIHKAFIDVNETGTEAAAATSIIMRATAMRVEPPPMVFNADHPFLFLIRDMRSGSILFLGRVTDPTK